MSQIRTTVSLDANLHQALMSQAVTSGMSLSTLVNKRLANQNAGVRSDVIKKQIADDLKFFKKLGKKMGETDWAKVIREERDRDGRQVHN